MDGTLLIVIVVCAVIILAVAALGTCLCKVYGVFGDKPTTMYNYGNYHEDPLPLDFNKAQFKISPVIKTGTGFNLLIGTKKKARLELSHIESNTVLILQLKADVSPTAKDIYLCNLEKLRSLQAHDHVISLYGSCEVDSAACTVIEFAHYGTLKYYLSYSAYKTFYDYRGFNDNDDTFANLRPPESVNSLQRKRNLFSYPKIVIESRKTPLSAHMLYYLMWQICQGMEYLHQNDHIHGSLCAFNVFVVGHMNLKINCFSLAFEDKYALNAIPRWIAPEIFVNKTLTKEGDVWAFGVTMWELFNCGAIPYNHLTVEEVISVTSTGEYQLTPPPGDNCISRLFSECFSLYPHTRPAFSEIRLVLEKLLSLSEIAQSDTFIRRKVLQYATTSLIDRIFYDQQEVDVQDQHLQRPLYFTLPSAPAPPGDMTLPPHSPGTPGARRAGSMSRIPITRSAEHEHYPDVTYADPVEYQNASGRNTGDSFDFLSTSSAEFEDISSSESCSDEEERRYNNMDPLHPLASHPKPSAKIRRISSLNDLVEFRRQIQEGDRPDVLARPRSVVQSDDKEQFFRRYNSEEGEEEEEGPKKRAHHHSSLRRFGSALHASFRRIKSKTRDESGYETLGPDKRSFRNLLKTPKKWKQGRSIPKIVPDRIGALKSHRKISQSETCLLYPTCTSSPKDSILHYRRADTAHLREISVSSGLSVPLSEFSDYEIPTEILEAAEKLNISKSKSTNELLDMTGAGTEQYPRQRSNSHDVASPQSAKHTSCIYDYKSTTSPPKTKHKRRSTRGILSSFHKKQNIHHVKSISDILGSPPPLPNNRRPSILCTCCNSIHVCQTLPGMSLTPNLSLARSMEQSRSPTYQNVCRGEKRHVQLEQHLSEDSLTDYEDVDDDDIDIADNIRSTRIYKTPHANKDYEYVVDIDEGYDPDHSKSDYEDVEEVNLKSAKLNKDVTLDVEERIVL